MTDKIPNEAVEAAADKLLEIAPRAAGEIPLWAILQALEAAAPHLINPRTITTAEELDALPSGSVIIDSSGEANVFHDNGWVLPGGPGGYTTWAVAQSLPATVLYEPQP